VRLKPMPLVGILIVSVINPASAQEERPLFTASTNSVVVDASVTGDQRLIEGLQREDFVLLDNGQPRTIAGLAHDELPLDIVLVSQTPLSTFSTGLWDNRGLVPERRIGDSDVVTLRRSAFASPRENIAQRLMNAAAVAVLGSRPVDRVALVSYGRDPRIDLRFTSDRKAIAAAIRRYGDPENGDENVVVSSEALAIEYAVRMLADVERDDPKARTSRRRLIVLISNIQGVGTPYADEPIIRRLWDQNIVLSVIDDARPTEATKSVQRSSGGESQTILFRRYNAVHIAQATGGDRIVTMDPL
jgi:VWFA-related protein